MGSNKVPLVLLIVVMAVFVWSAIGPHDTRLTWFLETLPFMLALPVLVLVTAALAWLVALGVAQVRVVDAARETARAIARGESVTVSVDVTNTSHIEAET